MVRHCSVDDSFLGTGNTLVKVLRGHNEIIGTQNSHRQSTVDRSSLSYWDIQLNVTNLSFYCVIEFYSAQRLH